MAASPYPYREVRAHTASGAFGQTIEIGPHRLAADEPPSNGGDDTGPSPHEWLLGAVASCVAMTIQAYAARKELTLRQVHVRVRARREEGVFIIERQITIDGDVDEAQRARMIEIGGRCPASRTLAGEIRLVTVNGWAE